MARAERVRFGGQNQPRGIPKSFLHSFSHSQSNLKVAYYINRPFAGSRHMVRNKLCWDANNAAGPPKHKNSYQSSPSLLCFESRVPLRYLRLSVIYSVPCERILQRAYYNITVCNSRSNSSDLQSPYIFGCKICAYV